MGKAAHSCNCLLCRPVPGRRAHPVWGYDLDLAPSRHCMYCDALIGGEPCVGITDLARFGQMFFARERCNKAVKERK